MKLKTAIYIVDIFYGVLIIAGLLSIVCCLIVLKDTALVVGLVLCPTLFITAFFVKTNLINYYLKNCTYPREFLLVLEKRGLMDNLDVDWNNGAAPEPAEPAAYTQQFFKDNRLPNSFGKPDSKWSLFICFENEALQLNQSKFYWKQIQDWGVMSSDSDTVLKFAYNDNDNMQRINIDLRNTGIDDMDFLLLFSHFKITYG